MKSWIRFASSLSFVSSCSLPSSPWLEAWRMGDCSVIISYMRNAVITVCTKSFGSVVKGALWLGISENSLASIHLAWANQHLGLVASRCLKNCFMMIRSIISKWRPQSFPKGLKQWSAIRANGSDKMVQPCPSYVHILLEASHWKRLHVISKPLG